MEQNQRAITSINTFIDNNDDGSSGTSNSNNGTIRSTSRKRKVPMYPLQEIISSMMFSNGDCYRPLEICQTFVLDFVRGQLGMLVERARKLAEERKRRSIGYLEMVFTFRRHPTLIKRLIKYIRLIELNPNLQRTCGPVSDLPNENEDDEPTCSMPLKRKDLDGKQKKSQKLINAVREFDVLDHLLDEFENWIDTAKMERTRRIAARTNHMDADLYKSYAEARQMSFCTNKGRKSPKYSQQLLAWLGAPHLDEGLVYVLNFCASEIVTILVEGALSVRNEQSKAECLDLDLQREMPLQLCHYEEALRRNIGYVKRKDILFGNF